MKFVFHLKSGGKIKTDVDGLNAVYQNDDLALVEAEHSGQRVSFILDGCKFVYFFKDGKHFVGKQKHVWHMNKQVLARFDDDCIFLEGV